MFDESEAHIAYQSDGSTQLDGPGSLATPLVPVGCVPAQTAAARSMRRRPLHREILARHVACYHHDRRDKTQIRHRHRQIDRQTRPSSTRLLPVQR